MIASFLLSLIRLYQLIPAPWVHGACRHVPSCSSYAHEAIERHGAARGVGLAMCRLMRCHPLGSSGFDPVP